MIEQCIQKEYQENSIFTEKLWLYLLKENLKVVIQNIEISC